MTQQAIARFADDARIVRERLMLDLDDRGARMIDATIRGLRAGTRQYAFRDSLIGLGEGLREVLLSWGIPDRCIFTNDTPVPGYFVERKFWDFVVRDASGRDVAVMEFMRIGAAGGGGVGSTRSIPVICDHLLGMLCDVSYAARPAFAGIVVVHDGPPRERSSHSPRRGRPRGTHRHAQTFERFADAGRTTGLLDALAYLDVVPNAPPTAEPRLGLENFLATLYGKLEGLPPGAWDVPRMPVGACVSRADRVSCGPSGRVARARAFARPVFSPKASPQP